MYVDPGRRRRRHRHGLLSLAAPSATISRQIRQVKTAIEDPKMLMVGYSFSPSNRTCDFVRAPPGLQPIRSLLARYRSFACWKSCRAPYAPAFYASRILPGEVREQGKN